VVELIGKRLNAIRSQKGRKDAHGQDEVPVRLAVDATGVGRAVVDLLRPLAPDMWAITITGGDAVSQQGRNYHVPKRDLVGLLQALMGTGRLKVASSLPDATTLRNELMNFRYKISVGGHDSYEAWRESDHDDLVLSVAIACWSARRYRFSQVA